MSQQDPLLQSQQGFSNLINQSQGFSPQNVVISPLGEPPGNLNISKHPVEGFDPAKSTISSENMRAWIQKQVSGHLQEVPGIGEINEKHLMNEDNEMGVSTTFQLIGKFLSFRKLGGSQFQQCDLFWNWLKNKNISHQRNNIVQAIAEKCNVMFPGMYDSTAFRNV
eukprot:gene19790-25731_t